MIKVEPILEIIEITIWTCRVKNEKPLSDLLIASVGDGKSEIIRKSYKPPKIAKKWVETKDKEGKLTRQKIQTVKHIGSVLYTTDTTPYILYHRWGDLLTSGQIGHIIIPDFLSILTKSKDTMPDTVRFYNSLIEEGIIRIESRFSDFITETPVQIGLITAISKQDFDTRSGTQGWAALGFLSRTLPVSYHYSAATKQDILKSTFAREYHNEQPFLLNLPPKSVYINFPKKYEAETLKLAHPLRDPSDNTGARRLKQIMTFTMAMTLKDGRDTVNREDMDKLIEYSKFFNSECKEELQWRSSQA